MRSDRDVIDAMAGAMSTLGLYIVLVFFAAQFVAYFKYTNLGMIFAWRTVPNASSGCAPTR